MLQSHTVLIIDDEVNLRESMAEIFRDAGHSVTCAGDGARALACLESGPYDLVLLDLRMPGMDGLSFLRHARRLYPEISVLILTGHATLDSATEALRLGARDYLYKPVDPAQLLARSRELLAVNSTLRRRELLARLQDLTAELRKLEPDAQAAPGLAAENDPPDGGDGGRLLRRGALVLDLEARTVRLGTKLAPVVGSAFDYLATLVRHAAQPVSSQTLVFESQGYRLARIEAQEAARWWIHQLRKAIEDDPGRPRYILTVRGEGYRLSVE